MNQPWGDWNLGVEDGQKLDFLEPSRFLVAALPQHLIVYFSLSVSVLVRSLLVESERKPNSK